MKNPLRKRILRELISGFGRYLAIFLFMTASIGFISGFLIAARSLRMEYDATFERYNIEDGHFVLKDEPDEEFLEKVEKKGVKLYPDYYVEETVDEDAEKASGSTLRLFGSRDEVNQICLLEGSLPGKDNEIALDRLYLKNNGLGLGETISVSGKSFTITASVALSDYSALYKNNNDMMFDATMFGVGVVTDQAFEEFGSVHLKYSYAWFYDTKPEDDIEEKEVSDDLAIQIAKAAKKADTELDIFIPLYANNSIQFAGEDMGQDKQMMLVLLYVLIAIMAFIFSITISHTVVQEAAVIGTLRASGYRKGEIFRHYLVLPMLVTLISAIVGNILGYTLFESVATDMYLGSYSLTTYVSHFNEEAFIKTTIVPLIIMALVNTVTLWSKLSFPVLNFLRRDLTKEKKNKNAVKLPPIGFFNRFRLRIIFQNLPGYFNMFLGIVFANLLLMFGMLMTPLLDNYAVQALEYKPANYQYILSEPQVVDEEIAEPYCVTSLKMIDDYYDPEDISVYGIIDNSRYYDLDLPENGVWITSDMSKKYHLTVGDIVNLRKSYDTMIYAFEVKGVFEYPTCLGIFMSQSYYCEVFQDDILEETQMEDMMSVMLGSVTGETVDDYYNGYFSDVPLLGTYLKDKNIASTITDDDLTTLSRQMDISMGSMFGMVKIFALVLFVLLIYLLTRLILEKNSVSISMVKVLGYRTGEIASLYLISSFWVVVISSILAMAINTLLFQLILVIFLKGYGGWFNLEISFSLYMQMFGLMVGTYLITALLQYFKIRRIPLTDALKNVE